ncbi:hypothetical protein EK904_011365 [Melospiza melodia maxima]|nr:hypothetical protein EK904_011365 [Melospiza melodia maxima]
MTLILQVNLCAFNMSSEDEIKERLDAELDRCIVAMKPYVLNLQNSSAGIGIVGRENRNLYAKLLLHMLQRGVLNGPFTQKPEEGILKTLPAYMSVYFDEPSSPRARSRQAGCLSEWVVGDLGNQDSNLSSVEDSSSTTVPASGERLSEKPSVISRCLSSPHRTDEDDLGTSLSDDQHKRKFSFDDDDLEARLNSWNLGLENPRYLREKRVPMTVMTPKIDCGPCSPSRYHQTLLQMQEKETFVHKAFLHLFRVCNAEHMAMSSDNHITALRERRCHRAAAFSQPFPKLF